MNPANREPFDPRLVFGLAAAGIVAFFGFVLLSAYAGDFGKARDGRAHALSPSAIGFKGLVDLIGYAGGETQMIRSLDDLDDGSEDLLIVPLQPDLDRDALDELLKARDGRATLLILPKWLAQPHPINPGWVQSKQAIDPSMLQKIVPDTLGLKISQLVVRKGGLSGRGFLEGSSMPAPGLTQTLAGADLEPLLVEPGGGIVLGQMKDRGALYLLADPDLLNNHRLKDKATASDALGLVHALNATDAETLMFDLTLSGFASSPNVLKLAFEPPFLPFTLTLLAAALLAGLHGAIRFGPAPAEARAIALGKAALVDNSAGLIRLARREHRLGGAYADLVRDAAAYESGGASGLSAEETEIYLDRIGRPGGQRFSALAAALRSADSRQTMLDAARSLFAWKKDISQ